MPEDMPAESLTTCLQTGTSGSRFPYVVALGLVVLLVGVRMWTGAGFGFQDQFGPAGRPTVASGFLKNPDDNLSYAAWAEQARNGRVVFEDLFTTMPHPRVFVNLYFLLVGNVSRVLNVPVTAVLILFGICGAALTVILAFRVALLLGFPETAARWGTIFAAFSSGFSGLMILINKVAGTGLPAVAADLDYQDALLLSTFFAYPYHSVALAGMALLIAALLSRERSNEQERGLGTLLVVPILALILSWTRPHEIAMLAGTYGLYVLLLMGSRDSAWTRSLKLLVIIGCAALPALVYYHSLERLDVWVYIAQLSGDHPRERWFWLIGYGAALPFAILGSVLCFRNAQWSRGRWFALWIGLLVVFLVVLPIRQTKICDGGHFPMTILAGLGFSCLLERVSRVPGTWARWLCRVGTASCCVLFFITVPFLLSEYSAHRFPSELKQVAADVGRLSGRGEWPPTVLCNTEAGKILPAIRGVRVFAGHWALTPEFDLKQEDLVAAGVEPAESNGIHPRFEAFSRLLTVNRFDYVLLKRQVPAMQFVPHIPPLQLVHDYGTYRLYQMKTVPISKK
ncbi:MAG: hypothetical protein HY914_20155 [Desulfomonile tiedjei]|nr:hypothetical protein [Desulfomonile tiedjei]